jgi:hypothetical protein
MAMTGVPSACATVAMDVQAELSKGTPETSMPAVQALARCMMNNGGQMGESGYGMGVRYSMTRPNNPVTTVMTGHGGGYGMGHSNMKGYGYGNMKGYGYYGGRY